MRLVRVALARLSCRGLNLPGKPIAQFTGREMAGMPTSRMTDKLINQSCNSLARKIMASHGFSFDGGNDVDFETHMNPRTRGWYALAKLAYDHFNAETT